MAARDRSLGERMAVAEQRLDRQAEEIKLAREKLHLLSKDRDAIRHAVRAVRELRNELRESRNELRSLVTEIADRAVTTALDRRDDDLREQQEARREGLSLRMQLVTIFVGAAGVATAIAEGLVR